METVANHSGQEELIDSSLHNSSNINNNHPLGNMPNITTNNNNNMTTSENHPSFGNTGSDINANDSSKCCAGCGSPIQERYLLHSMERYWHIRCLKCSCCQAPLGDLGQTCFSKAGMILCKNDYLRLFGTSGTCSACALAIPASEFVMRAQSNVYHLKCFQCITCHKQLVMGDRFGLVNNNLVCEQDYSKYTKSGSSSTNSRGQHKMTVM
ncbi:unnamed protein product [Owenia fusiformis]|uniref:Uncharacterized protein n=1 Tax=Owenia fusiformis TaxID=6347 RepID=A0A8J1XU12_OWEFU|nr:unnamed protein product [Owenia fusiformis]